MSLELEAIGVSSTSQIIQHEVGPNHKPYNCTIVWLHNGNQLGVVTSINWASSPEHAWQKLRAVNPEIPEQVLVRNIYEMDDTTLAGLSRYFMRRLLK